MGKTKYKWWGYVRRILYDYPRLRAVYNDLHRPQMGAPIDGNVITGNGLPTRTTERIALRELDPQEQREYDAVTAAMEYCLRLPDGESRYKLIDLMYWKRTHTLIGAAIQIPTSQRTAERWHGYIVRDIAARIEMYFG